MQLKSRYNIIRTSLHLQTLDLFYNHIMCISFSQNSIHIKQILLIKSVSDVWLRYIYIDIYIYRERERDREWIDRSIFTSKYTLYKYINTYTHMFVFIYACINKRLDIDSLEFNLAS